MKNRFLTTMKILLFTLLVCSTILQAQSIQFSLSSMTGKRGDTLLMPLTVNAINSGHGVISGQMVFTFNTNVLNVIGLQTPGTMLDSVLDYEYNIANKRLGFSDTGAITGSGVFAYLRVIINATPSSLYDSLKFQSIMLNEGSPTATSTNGYVRVLDMHISPQSPSSNLVVGDSLQFSVTGDRQLPLTWTSSNPAIATIDTNGKMRGVGVGLIKIHVADAQGLKDSTVQFAINSPSLRSLTIYTRDTSYTQTLTFNLPIYVTDVTSLGIVSARFSINYSSTHLQAVDVLTAGTMTTNWSAPSFNVFSGKVDVALAGAQPINGSGILAYVRMRVGSAASGTTTLTFSNVLFNEEIFANTSAEQFTPIPAPTLVIQPNTATLAGGDNLLFRVTSGGTPPYAWTTSNPTVATIHPANGWLTALSRGTTTVTVVDSFGFIRTTGTITVNDIRAKLPDTSIVALGDSVDIPIFFSGANNFGVISFETRVTYNSSVVRLLNVENEGTLCESFSVSFKDTLDTVRIAAAGTLPFSNDGILLRLKFKTAPAAITGQNSLIRFTQFSLNEPGSGTPTVRMYDGRVFVGVPDPSQYLEFTPLPLLFGNVHVGSDSTATVSAKSVAIEAMSINSVTSSHPDFSVVPTLGWLEPNDSTTFTVTFTPSSRGVKNGFIIFEHNAEGSPDSLPVSGEGIAPEFSVIPSSLDFNNVQLGNSKTDSVIVTNTGTAELVVSLVESNHSDYSITPTSATLQPSESQEFAITFSPGSTGIISGQISFTHNAGGSPHSVDVTGRGVATAFVVAPASLSFGDVLLGESKLDSVTVHNIGSSELFISQARANNNNYLVSPSSATVPPYESLKFYVTFLPSSMGVKNGFVVFDHNANGTPDSVSVGGRCIAPLFSVAPTSLNFEDVVVYSSKTDSVVVTNVGTADLEISLAESNNSDYSIFPTTALLLPSASRTFTITCTPSSIGAITGVVEFTHNAVSSTDSVTLQGTGIYLTVNVPISSRWNILSLPVVPVEDSVHEIFPNAVHPYAYSFDGTNYNQDARLEFGKGYWAKFPNAEVASLQGYPKYEDTIQVHEGWNLVGSVSQSINVSSITSNPPGMVTSLFYGFNGRYFATNNIEPGKGYWVKANQSGELLLSSLVSPTKGGQVGNLSLGKIKIIASDELPPPPPEGDGNEYETLNLKPETFALEQNYPNPFNPSTVIRYQLPVDSWVTLKVYNVIGEEVATLSDGLQVSGYRFVEWDASLLPSGVYVYRLTAGNFSDVKRLILLR
ncbi:MAG: choice-of-anchor D domain-containing protein [Ignavibacteriae bacterium]|nr:choice-of-anchor D domain-containing protein [Ignavibacteriota bacterium]